MKLDLAGLERAVGKYTNENDDPRYWVDIILTNDPNEGRVKLDEDGHTEDKT